MRRTNPRPTLAASLAIVLALAACSDSDPPPVEIPTTNASAPAPVPSSPSPVPPSAAPVTAEEAKEQALAAYMGMQDAFGAAGLTSDPDHPDLRKYTTGSALELFTTALAERKKDGILARGKTVTHARVTEVSPAKAPTKAVVQDCMDTRKTELYKANGDPVSQDKGGFRLAIADLERVGGTWKVTALAVRKVGTCKP